MPDWMVVKRKPEEPLVSQLEKTYPGMILNIGAPTNADLTRFQPEVANWHAPSIAILKGTTLGAAPFGTVYGLNGPEFHDVRMQDQFDALLYLGPPSSITFSELSKSRCTDERYMKMRLARMALLPWGRVRDQWPECVLRSAVNFRVQRPARHALTLLVLALSESSPSDRPPAAR